MSFDRSHLCRRVLCAVCALMMIVTMASPAAFADDGTAATDAADSLTRDDAAQMAQADAAVDALVNSDDYAAMSVDQRQEAAQAQLDDLAGQGLIQSDSIYYDAENDMVSFTYDCGTLDRVFC